MGWGRATTSTGSQRPAWSAGGWWQGPSGLPGPPLSCPLSWSPQLGRDSPQDFNLPFTPDASNSRETCPKWLRPPRLPGHGDQLWTEQLGGNGDFLNKTGSPTAKEGVRALMEGGTCSQITAHDGSMSSQTAV